MTECRCEQCCPEAPDYKSTRAYQKLCLENYYRRKEALKVVGMKTLDERQKYLTFIKKAKGDAEVEKLKEEISKIWGKK